ncbi:hypothetical protein BSG1_13351 [Bacillus sp. SG-1]|nr:hypothetical protein BSG1_13351 [Bacillus sp. SG-1]
MKVSKLPVKQISLLIRREGSWLQAIRNEVRPKLRVIPLIFFSDVTMKI